MQLSVGRMHFSHEKNKPLPDKEFGLVRVFVHDEASYTSVVAKFQKELFPDQPPDENTEYYIADLRGVPVAVGDNIHIQKSDGTQEKVQWSLRSYLKLSGIKYQSRARLYCVQKIHEGE